MRSRPAFVLALAVLATGAIVLGGCVDAFKQYAPQQPNQPVTWSQVNTIIHSSDAHCLNCHSRNNGGGIGYQQTGYSLDTCDQALLPDTFGVAVVVPGNADASPLIWRLEGHTDTGNLIPRMPFDGPPFLPQSTIDVVRAWIDQGASCQ